MYLSYHLLCTGKAVSGHELAMEVHVSTPKKMMQGVRNRKGFDPLTQMTNSRTLVQ